MTQMYDNNFDFYNSSSISSHPHEVADLSHEDDDIIQSFCVGTQVVGDQHDVYIVNPSPRGSDFVHQTTEDSEGRDKEDESIPNFLISDSSDISFFSQDIAAYSYE